jgi:RND family efflux transporter MFP subunit
MSLEAPYENGQGTGGGCGEARGARLAALALLLLAACSGAPAAPDPDRPPVEPAPGSAAAPPEAPPRPGYLGVVVARDAVDVAAEVAGRLEAVLVRPGDAVRRGDPLARLDTRALTQGLAMAEASSRAAAAELARSRAEQVQARNRLERRRAVPDTFSREELAQTQLEAETAEAAFLAAQARLAEGEARVAQLRHTLARTALTAPFDGTVALRYLDPGATVEPASPILRLITSDELLVRFAVPPEEAPALVVGAAVAIDLEATGARLPGRVTQVAPEIDAASQLVFFEARFEDRGAAPPHPVWSGQVARVRPAG